MAPDLSRLAKERSILGAEQATRGGSVTHALAERFGARGPGVIHYPRSTAAALLPDLLTRLLFDDLRRDAGGAYAPWATYEPVDAQRALVVGGSDVTDDLLRSVTDRTIRTLRRLSSALPLSMVRDVVEERIQTLNDPYLAFAFALRAADGHLCGQPDSTPSDALRALREVNAVEVAGLAEEMCESYLLGVPGDAAWEHQLPIAGPRTSVLSGTSVRRRHRDWPARRDRIAVSPDGHLSVSTPDQGQVAFDIGSAEAVTRDERDNRTIIDADGWSFTVDGREWHGGSKILVAIDEHTPADRSVSVPGGLTAARLPWWRRWRPPLPSRAVLIWAAIAIAWTTLLLGAVASGRGGPLIIGLFIALIVWAIRSGDRNYSEDQA